MISNSSPKLAVYDETIINVKKAQRQLIIRVDGAVGFKSVPDKKTTFLNTKKKQKNVFNLAA